MLSALTIRIILSIIVLIVLVIILMRFRANKNPAKDSLEVLEERYEDGKITKEEFEDAKRRRGFKS